METTHDSRQDMSRYDKVQAAGNEDVFATRRPECTRFALWLNTPSRTQLAQKS